MLDFQYLLYGHEMVKASPFAPKFHVKRKRENGRRMCARIFIWAYSSFKLFYLSFFSFKKYVICRYSSFSVQIKEKIEILPTKVMD